MTVRQQKELQRKFMNTFTKEYFLKHYGKLDKKNPPHKLKAYRNAVIEAMPKTKSKVRILDIGCGYGKFLSLLESENKFETYGIDTGSYAIKEAKKRTSKTKFWVGSISTFQPKLRFHIICAFDVLEHIPNLEEALKKIYDLLEKNGRFFCVVPVYDGVMGKIGGLLDKDKTHIHKKSRKFWIKKLSRQFAISNIEGIIRYTFPRIGYLHVKSGYLTNWGQAILVSTAKAQESR